MSEKNNTVVSTDETSLTDTEAGEQACATSTDKAEAAPPLSPSQIVSKLTLEEKASLASGKSFWNTQQIDRLGIPSVLMTDGPHGIRKVDETIRNNIMQLSHKATCFPPAVTVASSWNRTLAYEMGACIAEEAKAEGVTTILGPGINIKRSPLCGRNFEYFSEDPYVSGEMGTAFVKGVQDRNVGTSVKHYCANNQETRRFTTSSEVDERALREIYLPAFEKIVKQAKPTTIMSSYNRLNGVHMADNKRMLTDILRGEWGFDGLVMSDWGGINDRVKGVLAGNDLQMPSNLSDNKYIVESVENGTLGLADLDITTERLVKFAFECKEKEVENYKADYNYSHNIAKKIAADGAVLLKNDDNILPLDKQDFSDCLVIGALADKPRYQGTGSSKINPMKLVSFLDALKNKEMAYNYLPGYKLTGDGYSKKLLLQAREAAKSAKKVIIFVGLTGKYESEGYDRKHLNMPKGQVTLINEVASVNSNIVIVLACGSPVRLPFLPMVKGVLNLYLGGEACGEATYDLLFGDVNPSGKLAETFPIELDDALSSKYFPLGPHTVEYRESLYVGYRYFDAAKKDVLFPFGFGLSYTQFDYSDLTIDKSQINEDDLLSVSFTVTNTGGVYGGEVVQLYVRDVAATPYRPKKELKGFEKVYLQPNESKTVTLTLDSRAFAYYNPLINDWSVESGTFEIFVGKSSRDIVLNGQVEFVSKYPDVVHHDCRSAAPSYYKISSAISIPDAEFEHITGRPIDPNSPVLVGDFHANTTLYELRAGVKGRIFYALAKAAVWIVSARSENVDMVMNSLPDVPMRKISEFAPFNYKSLLKFFNGRKGRKKK